MWIRGAFLTFMGLAIFSLTLGVGSGQDVKKDATQKDAGKAGKDAKKDPTKDAGKDAKDAKKDAEKDKKFEVPKDAIAGAVKSVDMAKASFTITLTDKKDRTFLVDKATEFWGPRGGDRGTGPVGLKDDCMEPGYEIHVVALKDGKTAKDVYLPNRKSEPDDKAKKDKK